MIVAVPVVTPVTIPVAEPTVAYELPLVHMPPVTTSLNTVVAPIQTVAAPVIGAGRALTVIARMTKQPEPRE